MSSSPERCYRERQGAYLGRKARFGGLSLLSSFSWREGDKHNILVLVSTRMKHPSAVWTIRTPSLNQFASSPRDKTCGNTSFLLVEQLQLPLSLRSSWLFGAAFSTCNTLPIHSMTVSVVQILLFTFLWLLNWELLLWSVLWPINKNQNSLKISYQDKLVDLYPNSIFASCSIKPE